MGISRPTSTAPFLAYFFKNDIEYSLIIFLIEKGGGDVIFREGSRKKSNISIISNLNIWLTFHFKNRRIGKKWDSEDLKNRRIACIGIHNRRIAKIAILRIM